MLWHRWNDTETIDTPNYTKRPYLYELPVLRQDISPIICTIRRKMSWLSL